MERVKVRPAKWQDCDAIWRWRNDETTRKCSFNSEFIPLEKHRAWFKSVLADKNRKLLMVGNDRGAIGVVRFDISPKGQIAEVNINIAPEKRGKGLGLLALKSTCRYAFRYLNIKEIIAKVKKKNIPSVKMFSRAGFSVIEGNETIRMRLIPE